MTDKNLQRAKEIFFQYACNHFHLDREVDAEEYKKFDISNKQETIWTREYVSYWISQLSVDDLRAINSLRFAYAEEALPEMIRLSILGDSFSKLSYANAIWDIAHGGMMSPILRERARRKAVSLWQSILENPIELTVDHRKEVSQISATPDEYILDYAKSKLRESKGRNGFHFLLVSLFMGVFSVIGVIIDFIDNIKRFGKV